MICYWTLCLMSRIDFSFNNLLEVMLLVYVLLNCKDIYCLKVLFSSLAISLFQLDSYIKEKNFQAAKPNSEIQEISLDVLFSNEYCLINTAILRNE